MVPGAKVAGTYMMLGVWKENPKCILVAEQFFAYLELGWSSVMYFLLHVHSSLGDIL